MIQLLQFCVYGVKLESLFTFLVGDLRLAPSASRALALYDLFCAPGAPARLDVPRALPPAEPRLASRVEGLRAALAQGAVRVLPDRALFDGVVGAVRAHPRGPDPVARAFDPNRRAIENLPGGLLSPAQRAFKDNLWLPRLRPALVAAGFWRVAAIGG